MEKTIEELLQSPYWIIDILPKQVPKDSPGQYFAVEAYFLEEKRLAKIKQKHINMILKLNCYRQIIIGDDKNPAPVWIDEVMRGQSVCIRVDGSLILSEPEDTYLTLFDPDEKLLELVKTLASGEGLYVWKPEE